MPNQFRAIIFLFAIFSIGLFASETALAAFPKDVECLGYAMYKEAQLEGFTGQEMVASVLFNRSRATKKPLCAVLKARGQFPYARKGIYPKVVPEKTMLFASRLYVRWKAGKLLDASRGATHFCRRDSHPKWRKVFKLVATHRNHVFYKEVRRG